MSRSFFLACLSFLLSYLQGCYPLQAVDPATIATGAAAGTATAAEMVKLSKTIYETISGIDPVGQHAAGLGEYEYIVFNNGNETVTIGVDGAGWFGVRDYEVAPQDYAAWGRDEEEHTLYINGIPQEKIFVNREGGIPGGDADRSGWFYIDDNHHVHEILL